jgi:hypothetical protein
MSFSLFVNSETDSLIIECPTTSLESSSHQELSALMSPANFTIEELPRGFQLQVHAGEVKYEDDVVKQGSQTHILSGREFSIGKIRFIASVKSTRAEVSGREDVKSLSARGLIGLILLFELMFITVLPKTFTGEENFKREYLLEEISEELDILRKQVQGELKGSGKKNSMKSGILKDIKEALDDLANDLRLNPKSFSLTELEKTSEELSQCDKLILRLNHSPLVNGDKLNIDKQALLDQVFSE